MILLDQKHDMTKLRDGGGLRGHAAMGRTAQRRETISKVAMNIGFAVRMRMLEAAIVLRYFLPDLDRYDATFHRGDGETI